MIAVVSLVLVISMAVSIKLFQFFRKCHLIIGILSPSNRRSHLIDRTNWIFLNFQAQFILAMFAMVGFCSAVTYGHLIGKIEQFHECPCNNMCISFAIFLISSPPYSFVRYYIFNMGNEAFQFFLPTRFV